MKKHIVIIFILLVIFIAKPTNAKQVAYYDFELSLNINHDPTDITVSGKYGDIQTVYSFTVSLPSQSTLLE